MNEATKIVHLEGCGCRECHACPGCAVKDRQIEELQKELDDFGMRHAKDRMVLTGEEESCSRKVLLDRITRLHTCLRCLWEYNHALYEVITRDKELYQGKVDHLLAEGETLAYTCSQAGCDVYEEMKIARERRAARLAAKDEEIRQLKLHEDVTLRRYEQVCKELDAEKSENAGLLAQKQAALDICLRYSGTVVNELVREALTP